MLQHRSYAFAALGAYAQVSTFRSAAPNSPAEHHALLHIEGRGETFATQSARLLAAFAALCAEAQLSHARPIVKRYFLSDSTNQAPLLPRQEACAVSHIQQPPLNGSKIALWGYFVDDAEPTALAQGTYAYAHNGYTHLWQSALTSPTGDSATQTTAILERYEAQLRQQHASLAEHCLRTWFYCRDVDTHYAGLVRARLEHFLTQGLTPDTHYIASTGIQGLPAHTQALVQLEAYALRGFEPEQQRYLRALTHMNPTIEYGVTFERGVLLNYADRAHAYISGTASIDTKGEVLHGGDVLAQTQRMWENVEALMAEAEMSIDRDLAQIIVYLRDVADYAAVAERFAQRFPHIPTLITLAPVCRPEWLIEMEAIAIAPRELPQFRPF